VVRVSVQDQAGQAAARVAPGAEVPEAVQAGPAALAAAGAYGKPARPLAEAGLQVLALHREVDWGVEDLEPGDLEPEVRDQVADLAQEPEGVESGQAADLAQEPGARGRAADSASESELGGLDQVEAGQVVEPGAEREVAAPDREEADQALDLGAGPEVGLGVDREAAEEAKSLGSGCLRPQC
jgi:hypothetical protein